MPNILQIKRRAAGGGEGAPGALQVGELAVNFDGHTPADTLPSLYVGDGATVHLLMSEADRLSRNILLAPSGVPTNDQGKVPALDATGKLPAGFYNQAGVTVSAKTIPGNGTPAGDGNAQAAGAGWPWVVGATDVPVVTHDGSAYIFTGGAGSYGTTAGGGATALTAGMFTALGSATVAADAAQTKAGLLNSVFLTPASLANVFPPAVLAAGIADGTALGVAADANKIPTLDATGKIPTNLIPVPGLTFKSVDLTVAPPTGAQAIARTNGLVLMNSAAAAGTLHAGWGAGNNTIQPGDMLLDDGANYGFINSVLDVMDFVTRNGPNAATDAFTLAMAVPTGAGLVTRIDGTDKAKSRLSNFTFDECVMDAGVF